MQNLLNVLINGTNEYQEDGTLVHRPPNAAMLRASRELVSMANINTQNFQTLQSLQLRVEEQLKEITCLQELLNDTNRRNAELTTDLQNLRNDSKQDGAELNIEVGRSSGESGPCDSDGEGRGTN